MPDRPRRPLASLAIACTLAVAALPFLPTPVAASWYLRRAQATPPPAVTAVPTPA
ncbi:MAG: hypothetical protein IRY95_06525, partial [Clostridia bacterium]|nr:hypothetical protein [Clostridia bacterium]